MFFRSAFITAALFSTAFAARADTLTVGTTYSGVVDQSMSGPTINVIFNGVAQSSLGAGSLTGSTGSVKSTSVAFGELFCVDLADDLSTDTTYNASYTTDGTIKNGTTVSHAGQIAWLIENLGPAAATADQNLALQTAIWQVEYGTNLVYTGSSDPAVSGYLAADLAALGDNTAPVGSVFWISPTNNDGTNAQGLAGTLVPTPEPSSIVLLASGIVGVTGVLRRRFV